MEVVDEEDPAVDPEHVDGDAEGSELMLGMERVRIGGTGKNQGYSTQDANQHQEDY